MKKILILLLSLPVFAQSQTGSEIYLFDLKMVNNEPVLSKPVNITNHKGYDNQPFFHPKKSIIYYSSFNDSGRSDIKLYNYKSKETSNFTLTNEREYSPTLTPDGNFISCIIQRDNGAQDLGKYPVKMGEPVVLINTLKVGYHAWINKTSLLLFVLEDSGRNTLHYYNLKTKEDKVLIKNPGRSLHSISGKLPGTEGISFVEKQSKDEWQIKRYDSKTGEITFIAKTLTGREDLCWLSNGSIIMSDGTGLFYLNIYNNQGWKPILADMGTISLKAITRLAVSSDNSKLAVVASE
jgi:Tol biopolymer transport system component